MPRARDALLPAATGDAYLVDRGALKMNGRSELAPQHVDRATRLVAVGGLVGKERAGGCLGDPSTRLVFVKRAPEQDMLCRAAPSLALPTVRATDRRPAAIPDLVGKDTLQIRRAQSRITAAERKRRTRREIAS